MKCDQRQNKIKKTTTTFLQGEDNKDKSNNVKPERSFINGNKEELDGYMSRKLVIKDKGLNNFGGNLYRLDEVRKTFISSDMSQTI